MVPPRQCRVQLVDGRPALTDDELAAWEATEPDSLHAYMDLVDDAHAAGVLRVIWLWGGFWIWLPTPGRARLEEAACPAPPEPARQLTCLDHAGAPQLAL